jgi:hypothetical protein
MVWSREGEDVVVYRVVLAVPLDAEAPLVALGVAGKCSVAEPLDVAGLLDEVGNAGVVQRPETRMPGEDAHRHADLARHPWREESYPAEFELPPPAQSLDRPRVRLGSLAELHVVAVHGIARR